MGGHAKAFLVWSIVLLVALVIVLFAHHTTVYVSATAEPVQVQLPVTLDTSIVRSLPNLGVLAASVGASCVHDDLTIWRRNEAQCADATDIKQLATTAITASLSSDRALLVDSLSTRLEIAPDGEADEHRTKVLVFASASAVPIVEISKSDYYAKRKKESELQAYFLGKTSIKNVEIEHFPSFFRFLPFRYENLRIILDIE